MSRVITTLVPFINTHKESECLVHLLWLSLHIFYVGDDIVGAHHKDSTKDFSQVIVPLFVQFHCTRHKRLDKNRKRDGGPGREILSLQQKPLATIIVNMHFYRNLYLICS